MQKSHHHDLLPILKMSTKRIPVRTLRNGFLSEEVYKEGLETLHKARAELIGEQLSFAHCGCAIA